VPAAGRDDLRPLSAEYSKKARQERSLIVLIDAARRFRPSIHPPELAAVRADADRWVAGPTASACCRAGAYHEACDWLEELPPSALALNPVEQMWTWLTFGRLANFVTKSMAELKGEIIDRLICLRCDTKLLRSHRDGSEVLFLS
jgi:hypothetical protein